MIELKELNFSYGENLVFNKCDFWLPSNGLVAITGESGSGKSTLLKIIAGQLEIESKCMESQINKHDIIFINQYATLKNDLNIINHFKLTSDIYKCDFDKNHVKKIMDEVGLSYLDLNTLVNKISVGERKRLAIALALFADVKLLIIDEPTASLDFEIKNKLLKLLKKISKRKTVLITTHETEYDNLYDTKYHISNHKINLVFNNNSINSSVHNGDTYKHNIFKISKYQGRNEKIGLVLLVIVLLVVSNFTVFQQIQLIFESKTTSHITSMMSKNLIYSVFECVDRNLLPSDYTYEGYYDSGAAIDLEKISQIKDIEHIINVYPYYQLNSTNYDCRLNDVDSTISKVTILQNNQELKKYELDSTKSTTPSIVSYYEEELINNKQLSGNYINEEAAKELKLSSENFNDKITLSIEVGIPICSTIRNDNITYFENNVMQDTSYDYIANDIIYDKKTVTLDIDGILKDDEYENYYNSNGIGGLIYVNAKELDTIIDKNGNKDISNRLDLYTDLNEEIIDFIPSNYAIIVDSIDNIKDVKDKILKVDKRLLTYVPYNYYGEIVATRNSDITNSVILSAAYSLLSVAVVIMILYRYNVGRKNDIVFYQNMSLSKRDIMRLYMVDMFKAISVFVVINAVSYFMRIDYVSVYFYMSKGLLLMIFCAVSLVIGMILLGINYLFMKYIVYDKAR